MQKILFDSTGTTSAVTSTIFINRELFSNYYVGTLLEKEVRRFYGETGARMPARTRDRMLRLWDRVALGMGPSTGYSTTRSSLLMPLLSMLGYESLSEVDASELHVDKLPRGYYLYRPPESQALAEAPPASDDELQPLGNEVEEEEGLEAFFGEEEVVEEGEEPAAKSVLEGEELPQPQVRRRTAVLFSLLAWGQDFDRPLHAARYKNETPSKLMERVLAEEGPAQWGILFNGQRMRLQRSNIVAGKLTYFEIDLEALCETGRDEHFDRFWMLLRAQSFMPGPDGRSFLDIVEDESRKHASGVSITLKKSVFSAVEVLMGTLVEHARMHIELAKNAEAEPEAQRHDLALLQQRRVVAEEALGNLKKLYDQSLVFLYRLLFVLYAESRELLPVNNATYRYGYSLYPLRDEIAERRLDAYDVNKYRFWETLQALFRLIRSGCVTNELMVPAYNGSLFSPESSSLLEAIRVPDRQMVQILSDLMRTPETRARGRENIDYSDLGVEQLGAVYEGLLEFEPRVASEDMTEVNYKGRKIIIPQREQEKRGYTVTRTIRTGEFYLGRGAGRKTSGSYYTPQELVDFLVKRTLGPLVEGRSPEEILELKVVDPAMGSGAFLIGACHFLAEAYARALKRQEQEAERQEAQASEEGEELEALAQEEEEPELSEEAIRPYRRLVAERCLYGVDMNEMAVELAKVSLWLTTLAGDRPLTFLDANLRRGNSLIGAPLSIYFRHDEEGETRMRYTLDKLHPELLKRLLKERGKSAGSRKSSSSNEQPTLLKREEIEETLLPLVDSRNWIASKESETVADVHEKARVWREIENKPERQKLLNLCNLWIASWFWKQPPAPKKGELHSQANLEATPLDAGIYAELVSYYKTGRSLSALTLSEKQWQRYKGQVERIIEDVHPFHWELEFPEVYFNDRGQWRERPGFDAILGNPPWDRIALNSREFFAAYDPEYRELKRIMADARQRELLEEKNIQQEWEAYTYEIERQVDYYNKSAIYIYQNVVIDGKRTRTHGNMYKMFLERAAHLLRYKGRCGMIVPSAIYSDQGSTGIRKLLLNQAHLDFLLCFENRQRIFPIHRSFKFVLFGFEKHYTDGAFDAAFMLQELDVLKAPEEQMMHISSKLVTRFSPDTLSVMEFRSQRDLDVLTKIYQDNPLLGEEVDDTWGPTFRREFDMTDDRYLFNQNEKGWPLYEGKMIYQYTHRYSEPTYWIEEQKGRKELARLEVKRVEVALDTVAQKQVVFLRGETRQERLEHLMELHGRGPLCEDDVRIDAETVRLAFRSVASSTNERSLICSILPASVFLGNSLRYGIPWYFDAEIALMNLHNIRGCYRPILYPNTLAYLCGILNSLVLDYVLRFKVSANVNVFYVYQLPVPRLSPYDPRCLEIAERVARLVCVGPEFDGLRSELLGSVDARVVTEPEERQQVQNEIDALVARLYGLSAEDLEHILYAPYTFRLVKPEIKDGVMEAFRRLERQGQ